jgi:hypothetical protein
MVLDVWLCVVYVFHLLVVTGVGDCVYLVDLSSVLFIGTQFSILYTFMYSPA